jgi:hypothetical protein
VALAGVYFLVYLSAQHLLYTYYYTIPIY